MGSPPCVVGICNTKCRSGIEGEEITENPARVIKKGSSVVLGYEHGGSLWLQMQQQH